MDVTLKCHHVQYPEMGILFGSLDDEWSESAYWAKYECKPVGEDDKSLVAGGISTKLFGEDVALSEKDKQDNTDGLDDEDVSRICDGDHLFGRSKHTNGITRVMGCSHRENIIRSHVRGRFGDWLLPGRKGFHPPHNNRKHVQTVNMNSVPAVHVPRKM